MSTSLNIGYWSWQHRWRYPDEPDYKPQDKAPLYKPNPNPKVLPAVPTRLREDFEVTESAYTSHYLNPPRKHAATMFAEQESGLSHIPTTDVKGLRRVRAKGPAPRCFQNHHLSPFFDETPEEKQKVPIGEQPFRLWGRINPSYCVTPYMTEMQKAYVDYPKEHLDPAVGEFNMKVIRKDYKEAIAKAKNIEKDILANQSA
eukprot:CAMPEP_0175102202 /NCGR_PEP_ID=MMETSP0086_2-20121207/8286_1 /TAXON_ID=136419 /ORGANISM="Unknown Unknown, Strain D1" /LENGTH=200 /DNA_ID=CAMNT_0016376947 /DNA_START=22 /DNA_END=624 /DNA_ORIENTATION=-